MRVRWTPPAQRDLHRIFEFLSSDNPETARAMVSMLLDAPERLENLPRIGERLSTVEVREVRRLIIGRYEIRYEILSETIRILRIWHTREQR